MLQLTDEEDRGMPEVRDSGRPAELEVNQYAEPQNFAQEE